MGGCCDVPSYVFLRRDRLLGEVGAAVEAASCHELASLLIELTEEVISLREKVDRLQRRRERAGG